MIKLYEPEVYIPQRFGYFYTNSNGTPSAVSMTPDNLEKENFLKKYKELFEQYKATLFPFGLSLQAYNDIHTIGICIDIDKHYSVKREKLFRTDEEIEEIYSQIIPLLKRLNYGTEDSGGLEGGTKVWILFDDYVHYTKVVPFCKYLQDRFKEYNLEVYPNKRQWIRLPGLYKTRDRYSTDRLSGETLNTFDKVRTFFDDSMNAAKEVISTLDGMNLATGTKIAVPIKRKTTTQDKLQTVYPTGMDEYFPLIWTFITRTDCPSTDKRFSCPFHEDKKPSAIIRYSTIPGQEEKLVFFCHSHNCDLRGSESDPKPRDALDLLYYHVHGELGKKYQEGIEQCRRYLSSEIVIRLFDKWLIPKNGSLVINDIKLAEAVMNYMSDITYDGSYKDKNSENIEMCKDKNDIMYVYNPDTGIWDIVENPKLHFSIAYNITEEAIEGLASKWGVWHIQSQGLCNITNIVLKKLNGHRKTFEPNLDPHMLIPVQNGVIDVEKYIDGNLEECLIPYKKGMRLIGSLETTYDPRARNDMYTKWRDIYLPDEDERQAFELYMAISLLPRLRCSYIMFCHGSGGNGKGTLLNLFIKLFGDKLCSQVSLADMENSFQTYLLRGSYINIDTEASQAGLATNVTNFLKKITGDSPITTGPKFVQPFSIWPFCKLAVACNQVPNMGKADNAIARRFLEIPFKVEVPKMDVKGAFWKLIAEHQDGLSGILNELLKHLPEYIRTEKFPTLRSAKENQERYFKLTDPVYAYILSIFEDELNDVTKHAPKSSSQMRLTNEQLMNGVDSSQLYQDYLIFLEQSGLSKSSEIQRLTLYKFRQDIKSKLEGNVFDKEVGSRIVRQRVDNKFKYKFKLQNEESIETLGDL